MTLFQRSAYRLSQMTCQSIDYIFLSNGIALLMLSVLHSTFDGYILCYYSDAKWRVSATNSKENFEIKLHPPAHTHNISGQTKVWDELLFLF